MTSGGARGRSGPPKDPNSGRTEKSGIAFGRLPAAGRKGRTPKFPLPPRWLEFTEDGQVTAASQRIIDRELELWRWAWRTPQACAWELPHESWRINNVAMWVRTFVICEGPEATAADKGALHRFADSIGFSDAGLRMMGYVITVDEVAKQAAKKAEATAEEPGEEKPKRRLRGV